MTTITGGSALTSALQKNVLAVQQQQNLINQVQERLSTGLRVNSVIDNPNNFFKASSLNNRSARLNTLLDNVISNLTTIQEAATSVSSLSDLIDQIDDVANNASDSFTASTPEAIITGTRTLSTATDLTTDVAGIDNNDRLLFSFVDTDGSISSGNTVTISTGDSTRACRQLVFSGFTRF